MAPRSFRGSRPSNSIEVDNRGFRVLKQLRSLAVFDYGLPQSLSGVQSAGVCCRCMQARTGLFPVHTRIETRCLDLSHATRERLNRINLVARDKPTAIWARAGPAALWQVASSLRQPGTRSWWARILRVRRPFPTFLRLRNEDPLD